MLRLRVFALPLVLAAATCLQANPADGDPRLESLFRSFIAPCCWSENLLVHQSSKAAELRAEIRRMAGDGKTDDQIKAALIKEHTIRILSLPEGARGQWLSWMPVAVFLAGLSLVGLAIKRSTRPNPQLAYQAVPEFSDADWDWDPAGEPDGKPR